MFALAVQTKEMLAFCTSWPLTDICDNPNTASNQAGAWNHGAGTQ